MTKNTTQITKIKTKTENIKIKTNLTYTKLTLA